MFSHVTVGCHDLERAAAFYDAVLTPLGLVRRTVRPDGGPPSACWISHDRTLPRFYVYMPFDGRPASAGNGSMVAFSAASMEAVDASFAAGLAANGSDDGAPGLRPNYGVGHYGAYLRDPDGNKVHLAFRGDLICHSAKQESRTSGASQALADQTLGRPHCSLTTIYSS